MKLARVTLLVLLAGCSPLLAYEASVGGGIITQGGEQASNGTVVKGDFFANLNKYFALGFSVGEAFNFDKHDGRVEIRDNGYAPAGSFAMGSGGYGQGNHQHDDEISVQNPNADIIINIIETPGQPLTVIDMTEKSYFFGEPTARLSYPIGIVTPYVKGFAGASILRTYGGESIGAFSSGAGVGLKLSLGFFFVNWEWLHRRLEARKTTLNNDQWTGAIGLGF